MNLKQLYTAEDQPSGTHVFEDVLMYSCDEGYEYKTTVPEDRLVCTEDGTWNPTGPDSCLPISCGIPPTTEHGSVQADNHEYEAVATYECDYGYYMLGGAKLTCLADK